MNLYKRHEAGCQCKNGSGKDKDRSHRCCCSIYVEWNLNGKQNRRRVKDAAGQPVSSWIAAEKLAARNTEDSGNPSAARTNVSAFTLQHAVDTFIKSKEGEDLAEVTVRKLRITLNRLVEYCKREGITLLRDVTLPVLTSWRAEWTEKSPTSKANQQGRVRSFFRYCVDADFIVKNPAKKLSRIAIKQSERTENVKPLEDKEYKALLKAVDHVKSFTAAVTVKVKALMQLQRFSGLALVDAVCLHKNELQKDPDGSYRIVTNRQKSGEPVNNVIPAWLAQELLAVKNGNSQYFFSTGEATPKSAVSLFDKYYRKAFEHAGIKTDGGLSHRFRHTYSVELLKAGVDIRKVSKALGHASVTTTEKYYSLWNRAQQDTLDAALSSAVR